MGLDRRLAATLGAGGAVCGVSGAIAIAGAVGAKQRGCADRHHRGDPLGDRHDLRAAARVARARICRPASPAPGSAPPNSPTPPAMPRRKPMARSPARCEGIAGTSDQASLRLHADEGGRPRRLDRHLGLRPGDRRDDALGASALPARGPDAGEIWRRFPKFVIGFVARLDPRHRGDGELQPRRFQQDRQSRPDRADQGSAHLGLHLLLPQHRADDALWRTGHGGAQTVRRLQRRRRRQRRARLRAVGLCVRILLANLGK